jgi:hypothetical protein
LLVVGGIAAAMVWRRRSMAEVVPPEHVTHHLETAKPDDRGNYLSPSLPSSSQTEYQSVSAASQEYDSGRFDDPGNYDLGNLN